MNVVKFEFPKFVESAESVAMREAVDKSWKGLKRVERHIWSDPKVEVFKTYRWELGQLVGKSKAKLEKFAKPHDKLRAAYFEQYYAARAAWVAEATAAFEELLKSSDVVELHIDHREVLDAGRTRGYESTFGQTAWGCHSSYATRMNGHGYTWETDVVLISSRGCTDISHCTYWPPAMRNEMLVAVGKPPVVSMDSDNLAYQHALLRG